MVHFYRNVLHAVPRGKANKVALMLKAVHAQEDKEAARRKSVEVVSKLRAQHLEKAPESWIPAVKERFRIMIFQWPTGGTPERTIRLSV